MRASLEQVRSEIANADDASAVDSALEEYRRNWPNDPLPPDVRDAGERRWSQLKEARRATAAVALEMDAAEAERRLRFLHAACLDFYAAQPVVFVDPRVDPDTAMGNTCRWAVEGLRNAFQDEGARQFLCDLCAMRPEAFFPCLKAKLAECPDAETHVARALCSACTRNPVRCERGLGRLDCTQYEEVRRYCQRGCVQHLGRCPTVLGCQVAQ